MIDIKLIREQKDLVAQAIHNKKANVDLDLLIELDTKRVRAQQELDELRAERNRISAEMPKGGKPDSAILEKAKAIKESIQTLEESYNQIESDFITLYKKVPNIPTDDTPVGLSEEENVIVKQWGTIRSFDFPIKNHAEIAEARGWLDKERAGKVAGTRFGYLKGDLVRLQMALVTWVMDTLSDGNVIAQIVAEHKLNISTKPFTAVLPPYMIRTELYDAMDRLEPREDRYKIE